MRRADLRRDSLVVLRHIERRSGQWTYAALHEHLTKSKHGFSSEAVDRSVAQLIFAGLAVVEGGVVMLRGRTS